jgi:putative DNA primase/helicase
VELWEIPGQANRHDRGCSIKARELFGCYQEWCEENNERACSERFFWLRLKELGIDQKRYNDGRYWQGIMVKAA